MTNIVNKNLAPPSAGRKGTIRCAVGNIACLTLAATICAFALTNAIAPETLIAVAQ